ncbi:MAG: O-methyltransferase [Planctomycetota bacterium]
MDCQNLLYSSIYSYLSGLLPERHSLLLEAEKEAEETGFPIIGPVVGNFCYTIARLMCARRVFELGSGFGYSTAWFAKAVRENGGGEVHHTVWDSDHSARARMMLKQMELDSYVVFHVSEAVKALRESDGFFDIIFNDIDKEQYPDSLAVIAEKLRPGGALIIDNTLWDGRVFDESDKHPSTEGIREVSRILRGSGWAQTVLPLRDGVTLAVKVS